jgi:hypothetical protein
MPLDKKILDTYNKWMEQLEGEDKADKRAWRATIKELGITSKQLLTTLLKEKNT